MTEGAGEGLAGARSIGEVAEELKLPQHVLRFWETRFPQVKPLKRAGGRRLYRADDVALLRAIKDLLYGEGYTIKGVQRLLQDQGAGAFAAEPAAPAHRRPPALPPPGRAADGVRGPPPSPAAADRAAVARLAAVLSDLAECARILALARGTEP